MSIKKKLDELIKNNTNLSFQQMRDIFGSDFEENLLSTGNVWGNDLIFSENDNLYHCVVGRTGFTDEFFIRPYNDFLYEEVDGNLYREILYQYNEALKEVKKLEAIALHKKFRLRTITSK